MRKKLVGNLHAAVVARAREQIFFVRLGVPDTLDGRFDLLALHAWLVLDRLRETRSGELSQGLMDAVFLGFDEGLRELGAGDMGMGRRMKKLADAFYGRLRAYDACGNVSGFADALQRNLYRGAAGSAPLSTIVARYAQTARLHLSRSEVAAGAVDFGPLPNVD
jgi:cytochrome b pre-mRNA-processing protein 3